MCNIVIILHQGLGVPAHFCSSHSSAISLKNNVIALLK
jgi:hypothetical protein